MKVALLLLAALVSGLAAGVASFAWQVPPAQLREEDARPPCWVGDFSKEKCCSGELRPEECAFDPFFFTKEECCTSDYSVLDPYGITTAVPIAFPALGGWAGQHPALQPEQRRWEALMGRAAVVRRVPSPPLGDFELRVFKGDMTDIQLYNLDRQRPSSEAPRRVVDVGGNYGGTAIALARLFPEARVVVLEPNPLLCRFLLWNLREHGLLARVWPLCAGLGAQEDVLAMAPCREPWVGAPVNTCINLGMRTFSQQSAQQGQVRGRVIDVPVLPMQRVLAELQWDSLDLLKIDCEGCEWAAFLAPRAWLTARAVGELHFGCGATSCWPARSTGNCSVASFTSFRELAELLWKCQAHARVAELNLTLPPPR